QVQCSVAEYPEAITYLLEQYDRVEAGEARLSDLITAFIDPNAEEVAESDDVNLGKDDDEIDNSADD
ncbi:RNA polymerase sigma factor RpoD, partial [Klebsiella oxytoca]